MVVGGGEITRQGHNVGSPLNCLRYLTDSPGQVIRLIGANRELNQGQLEPRAHHFARSDLARREQIILRYFNDFTITELNCSGVVLGSM